LSKKFVYLAYKIEENKKSEGRVVGIDQGILTACTLSDGQTTGCCPHGHDLNSILVSFNKLKKGSRKFGKKREQRKNYINWAINQLDLDNIKEIRFEKIRHIRRGKRNSKFQDRWTYTLIRDKLERICAEHGIKFTEVPNEFNSQRCSACGLVLKKNRSGKNFRCVECGFATDADLNAACNCEDSTLCEIPYWMRSRGLHRGPGFYWLPGGLFHRTGEPIVPLTKKAVLMETNVSL